MPRSGHPPPGPFVVALLALAMAGCAGGRFVRPVGPGSPSTPVATAWTALSEACRQTQAIRAELRVSGQVDGAGFPTLTTGLALDADRMSLVALAGARRVFNLAGQRSSVTLLNHLDGRATRGPAAAVLEALVGIRLEPDRLLGVLTGCPPGDATVTRADRVGDVGRIVTPEGVVYLSERNGQWQLAAAEFADVLVDYRRVEAGWPRDIELRRGAQTSLRLRVIEFERNPQLPPVLFQLQVPAAFVEMPLELLQQDGPLGRRDP